MLEPSPSERDAMRVTRLLRRLLPLIVVVTLIGAAAAYVIAHGQPKKYKATAALLFENSNVEQIFFGVVNSGISDPTQQLATNISLVELPGVAASVARRLHLPETEVQSEMSFGAPASSDVVSASATDASPARAARLANVYVQTYVANRTAADRAALLQAQRVMTAQLAATPPADRNSAATQTLSQENANLKLLATVANGGAEVVDPATVPQTASTPKPKTDALLGGALGFLASMALVLGLGWRDRRIRSPKEAEEIFGVRVLGEVPVKRPWMPARRSRQVAMQECFAMLRAQLRYGGSERPVRRVLVTSAEPRAGKSFVALNLAWAAACAGEKSLLIEADLRRPSLAKAMQARGLVGLTEFLLQTSTVQPDFRELVVSRDTARENGYGAGRSDVLLAGAPVGNPMELLAGSRMAQLLESAAGIYDVVIVDAPAMGVVGDAFAVAQQVDAVIVVTRLDHSARDDAVRLIAQLRELRVDVLGLVINGGRYRASYPGRIQPIASAAARATDRSQARPPARLATPPAWGAGVGSSGRQLVSPRWRPATIPGRGRPRTM